MNGKRNIHNIALIGFMGVGKSSVGQLVAELLRFDYVDTDQLIETRTGKTINQIFEQNGEAEFRKLENEVVAELAKSTQTVISCGGGLAANTANLESLKEHALVVCLWCSPEQIWQRVRHQTHRPLLVDPDPLGKIRTLLAAREKFYRQAAAIVSTDLRPIKEVAQQVIHQFRMAQADRG